MAQASTVILGTGAYAPARVLSNDELSQTVDTSDEWIRTRTGIRERRIAAPGEQTSDMGVKAALAALADAKLTPADIDLLIVATVTPDYVMPAVACIVQQKLGLRTDVACFDLNAACSGFVYALDTGCAMVGSGRYRRALVIGVDKFSAIVDWQDRTTCVLFGDGAGAVVLEAMEGTGTIADRGVLTSHLRSDGRHREKLYVDGGPGTNRKVGHLRMEGREVFRHAVGMITDVISDAFAATGTTAEDLDWFVPHQANRRIIDASAHKLGIAPEKVVVTVDRHGNTSAASIPLALAEAKADGRIKEGDLVMLEAMGGGFTWGSVLVRW